MADLDEAFDRLLAEHAGIGSPVPEYVRPGTREDDIRRRLAGLELVPSDEVVRYFARQDGIDDSRWLSVRPAGNFGALYLFPAYESPSLREVEVGYRLRLRGSVGFYGPEPRPPREIPEVGYWARTWLPIFFGDYSYAADCRGGTRSVVWGQASQPGARDTVPLYGSVAELLDDVAGRLHSGIITWTPRGFQSDQVATSALNRRQVEQGSRLGLESTY